MCAAEVIITEERLGPSCHPSPFSLPASCGGGRRKSRWCDGLSRNPFWCTFYFGNRLARHVQDICGTYAPPDRSNGNCRTNHTTVAALQHFWWDKHYSIIFDFRVRITIAGILRTIPGHILVYSETYHYVLIYIGHPISISILYTIPDSKLGYYVLSQNLSFGIIYHLRACTGIF